ncbi:DUF5696 domain-containing protein [Methanocalculus natronophilus]
MEGRMVIENGIVQVTYSNDVYIIINYTSQNKTIDSVEIEPFNYYVGGLE